MNERVDVSRQWVAEVFTDKVLSDLCHDEVLTHVEQDLNPNLDYVITAIRFLAAVTETSKRLATSYEKFEHPDLKIKGKYFRAITPESMAARTAQRVQEAETAFPDFVDSRAKFVNEAAQEARVIFRQGLALKAERQV